MIKEYSFFVIFFYNNFFFPINLVIYVTVHKIYSRFFSTLVVNQDYPRFQRQKYSR